MTALLEGSRPILIEVQALAAKAGFGTPQRVATGYDGRRLALLLAVLDKRAGLSFAQLDVFLNVVGGLRLAEPAGDLAVAAALASAVTGTPTPEGAAFVGEVSLTGLVRQVSGMPQRLAAAEVAGCSRVFGAPGPETERHRLLTPVRHVSEALSWTHDSAVATRRRAS